MTASYVSIPPAFLNMLISVEVSSDKSGNTPCKNYNVICTPPNLVVVESNTIITFQLVSPTPAGVRFASLEERAPLPTPQLSTPSISLDGTLLTLCDANTVPETIDITFLFADGERKFGFDPQVQNVPH